MGVMEIMGRMGGIDVSIVPIESEILNLFVLNSLGVFISHNAAKRYKYFRGI